jgi:hypothetical protein
MMKLPYATMSAVATASLLTAAQPSVADPPTMTPPADIEVCELFTAAQVSEALSSAGLAVQVAAGQSGVGSCRYAISGGSARALLIDAAEFSSDAEARRQHSQLVSDLPGARPVTGVGDEAVLLDNGPYGTYGVKYRSGRVLGQVNLRADGVVLEAAVIAVARRWTGALARRAGAAAPAPARTPPLAAAEPASGPERRRAAAGWERVPEEPRRSLPPLPPLRWADPDSAARARGLTVTMEPPTLPAGVSPELHAFRTLSGVIVVDTLFSAEAADLFERQIGQIMRQAGERRRGPRGAIHLEAPGRSAIATGAFAPDGFVLAAGPSAADQWWLPSSGRRLRTRTSLAPRPEWFRDSQPMDVPAETAPDGTTVSGRAVMTRYLEPWRRGIGITMETIASKSVGDASVQQTYRNSWEVSTDICPTAEGIVKGRGTLEVTFERRAQRGSETAAARVHASNAFTFNVRVTDDGLPASFDMHHSVEATETVQGAGREDRDLHWITETMQTNIDPGISIGSDGAPSRQHTASSGTLHLENVLSTDASAEVIAYVTVFASSYAKDSLEEAFNEWWAGSCLEVRSRRQPERPRLRAGESADFELEVFHYQDEDVVALPIEIQQPASAAAGSVSPTQTSEGPARFTFTAPTGAAWQAWDRTEVRSHSTSRRGRAHLHAEGPVFSRSNEREHISVSARRRTSTELLGDVLDFTFKAVLVPDRTDPGKLRAEGYFEGTIVGLDANCLDGYDIPPSVNRYEGMIHREWGGFLSDGDSGRVLHLTLTGDLPPLDGMERDVGFAILEGIALPPSGSTATYRKVLPHGFTGTMTQCSGEVQSIWEITLSPWRHDG